MSDCNLEQKANFSAIYRLEFYKKQKNWKLSHEDKKCDDESDVKNKVFNVTYNLNAGLDENPLPVNKGFMENEFEANQPMHSLKETEIFAETLGWAAEEQDHMTAEDDPYMWMHPESEDQDWPQHDLVHEQDTLPLQDIAGQDVCDYGGGEDGFAWPQGRGDVLQQADPGTDPFYFPEDFQYCCDVYETPDEEISSVGSFSEFTRGAHFAPHSSEVELQQDTMESIRSSLTLDTVSGAELCALTAAHTGALSALFTEILRRSTQYELSGNATLFPYTQTDVNRPGSCDLGALMPVGRGRGRLRTGIGIGMGRPYRYVN